MLELGLGGQTWPVTCVGLVAELPEGHSAPLSLTFSAQTVLGRLAAAG